MIEKILQYAFYGNIHINADVVASELLVENIDEFIQLVLNSGYYISEITWWERTKVDVLPVMGDGGFLDPRCPNEYMFADIYWISQDFSKDTKTTDYVKYINAFKKEHFNVDLYPAVEIRMRNTKKQF